jgi:hypothetical protein
MNKIYYFPTGIFLYRIFFVLIVLLTSQSCISAENKFSVAGFEDPDRVIRFLNELQDSVKNNKKRHIATLILFPFKATVTGKDIEIDSMDKFLKNYDQIFNLKVRNAVLNEKLETLSVNSNGIMIGRGEIWFTSYIINDKKITAITTINN